MSETTYIENAGSCIATAQAISGQGRIRWMTRTPSAVASDSGWRFYADEDDEENVAHTTNMRVVDFNQVVHLEPIVASVYDYPVGSDFELVTLPDGSRQLRDTTTGLPVGAQGEEPAVEAQAEQPVAIQEPVAPAVERPASGPEASQAATADNNFELASSAGFRQADDAGGLAQEQAVQDAAVAASAAWLRPAVQEWMATPTAPARTAMLSELFGAHVFVPVSADGSALVGFAHNGVTVIPLHTSREGLQAWQERLGVAGQNQADVLTGDEALRRAFEQQGAFSVVIDPLEAGVEVRSDDQFLGSYPRNGRLKSLLRAGDREAVLAYLMSDGAYGVYLYRAEPGQQAFPLLVNRQGTGEREFALFSSALEVFRFQSDGSAAEVTLDWVRQNLAEDMYLCVDPGAQGGFLEFSPAELAAVGFRQS